MSPTSIYSIISRIQERLSNFQVTDESIDLQLIEDTCHIVRLQLLDRSKRQKTFYQEICCLPVECEDVKCGDLILEQVKVINLPNFSETFSLSARAIGFNSDSSYFYLGQNRPSPRGRRLQNLNMNSFTTIGDNKIVIFDSSPIEFLCVRGVFDNPYDSKILSCSGDKNPYKEEPYPMDGSMYALLEDTVFRLLVATSNGHNETDDGSKKMT